MMRTLLSKTLYDKRWFTLGWSLVIVFTVVLTIAFYPSFSQGDTFEKLSQSAPGQLKGFIGDEASFHTIQGYTAEQLYNFRIPLMLLIMALVLAQGLTVSDEEKGTLRTLAALPLSRSRILWEKWLAGIIIFTITIVVAVLSGYITGLAINETVSLDFSWKIAVVSWLFALAAFSIMYAIGAASGSRSLTLTIGLIIIMGGFILTTFGTSVDWLKDWQPLSLMHYADTASIVKNNSLDRLNLWVLAALGALSQLVAVVLFRRRDIS